MDAVACPTAVACFTAQAKPPFRSASLASPARPRHDRLRCAAHIRLPTVALFGPSKGEQELLRKLETVTASLNEAVRRSAEASLALEAERAARKKVEEERDMLRARLAEAEKDVFKLERLVQETERKLTSYQTTAERQIELMADALKKAGIQL